MTYNHHKHFYVANQWIRFEYLRIEKNVLNGYNKTIGITYYCTPILLILNIL